MSNWKTWIWKIIGPSPEESRYRQEITALLQEREQLIAQLRPLTATLETRDEELDDLRQTNQSLTVELREANEAAAAARQSEQAHLRNLELLKSAIDQAVREVGRTAPVSPEAATAISNLAERLVNDTRKAVLAGLTIQNYSSSKKRYQNTFDFCAFQGAPVRQDRQVQLLSELEDAYRDVVRKAAEREEQARIKAQIREEQRLEAERQRELKRLEDQQSVMEEAIARALARTRDEHSREVQELRAQLESLRAERERAIAQAQLTKAGHVYVISNIGSFGEGVYKIGMTRRLEPLDRVYELSSASVPFPLDVHMMISCTDAPALESTLHREFHKLRLNKVNPRKEFFRVDLNDIVQLVHRHHGQVEYAATPEAFEYRESMTMSDEDAEFLEEVLQGVRGEEE